MVRRRDIKKSDFTQVNDSQSTDTFDFVRNGQNLKISQTELIQALGLTGELQTRGEVAAIPVLRVIASENYIRNILGTRGIAVSVSAQDGVQVGHNFTVDTTGVPIMINEGADSPTFRSFQAGAGINISGSGNIVQISSSEIPATTKTVVVTVIGDFPAPVGDLITLDANTQYFLQNDVSSAFRFQMSSNTVLAGSDANLCQLEYTGIGTMITATDVSFKTGDIRLTANSGTMFDVSSTSGLHNYRSFNVFFDANIMGSFDNMNIVDFEAAEFTAITDGFSFTNNFTVIRYALMAFIMPSGAGTAIDLGTCTCTSFAIENCLSAVSTSGYVLDGALSSGNINTGGLATLTRIVDVGTSTFLNNISSYDSLWEMLQNTSIPDSNSVMLATHGGATLTIGALGTPVIVGATWVTEVDHRFTTTVGGRFTYTGRGKQLSITASITADIATGIDDVSFFVYINGVQITNSRVTREFDAGNPGNMSLIWTDYLDTNDYVELWAQNDDAAVDITIINLTLRID